MYATGGDIKKNLNKDALNKEFDAGIIPEAGEQFEWVAPTFEDGHTESVFTEQGIIRIADYNLESSVYYAVTNGPGGKGYMLVLPQDEQLSQNNSSAATALINFLGGLTADQFTNDGNQVDQQGVPQRYVIQSMAGVSLRITFDFAAGTSTTDAIMTVNIAGEDGVVFVPNKVVMLRVGPEAFFARPV